MFSIINVWGSTCWTCHGSTIQTRFFWVMEICMQMQVCSINPIGGLAKGNIPHMYVRTTMSFGGAVVMYINGRL